MKSLMLILKNRHQAFLIFMYQPLNARLLGISQICQSINVFRAGILPASRAIAEGSTKR